MAAPDPQQPAGALPAPDAEAKAVPARAPRATNAGRVWVAMILAVAFLALLIVFVAENPGSVTVSFLGAHGRISLALALLIAALVGAAVVLLAGSTRILQLRAELRRLRR